LNIPLGDLHIRFDDSPHGQLNPATSIAMPMYAAGFAKASAADDLANLLTSYVRLASVRKPSRSAGQGRWPPERACMRWCVRRAAAT